MEEPSPRPFRFLLPSRSTGACWSVRNPPAAAVGRAPLGAFIDPLTAREREGWEPASKGHTHLLAARIRLADPPFPPLPSHHRRVGGGGCGDLIVDVLGHVLGVGEGREAPAEGERHAPLQVPQHRVRERRRDGQRAHAPGGGRASPPPNILLARTFLNDPSGGGVWKKAAGWAGPPPPPGVGWGLSWDRPCFRHRHRGNVPLRREQNPG